MRRTTTLSHTSDIPQRSTSLRRKTFVTYTQKPPPQTDVKNNFMLSQFVVSDFIEGMLIDRCLEEMEKRQLPRLINQAIKQCDFYLRYQAWQIDPQGPYKQKILQPSLQPDKQPQCIILDPMITFKRSKSNMKLLRNSLSRSSLTKESPKHDRHKHLFAHNVIDRKQSTLSNTTTVRPSKAKFTASNLNLIPLRFENGITPDLTSRRTLEDFLREKKKTVDGNTGHKIPTFSSEKDSFKIISQVVPKSNFFTSTTTSKNFQSLIQHDKFPQISAKEELGTDYDGKAIQIKKVSNLTKPTHVLKMLCKLKQDSNEIRKQYIHSKHFIKPQQIRLKPINERKHTTTNISVLTLRVNGQQDVRSLVQDGLYTNRIKFRYQQQSGDT